VKPIAVIVPDITDCASKRRVELSAMLIDPEVIVPVPKVMLVSAVISMVEFAPVAAMLIDVTVEL